MRTRRAKLTVIEHIRFKYAAMKNGESTIVTATAQPSPLPKSNASAGLLANIQVNTFVDHLPIHRQEMGYARLGIHLPRATLCEWKLGAAELLETLLPSSLLAKQTLQTDDWDDLFALLAWQTGDVHARAIALGALARDSAPRHAGRRRLPRRGFNWLRDRHTTLPET
ncbi:transposase [Cupriavidus sp. CuC1]|uniref:IS66 family transposase n=1 Tax=Cupriavidus sp. CuC1 TaxID=3373131 RepID=UPI0037D51C6C